MIGAYASVENVENEIFNIQFIAELLDMPFLDVQFEEYLARAEVLKQAINGREVEVTPAGTSAAGAQKAKPKGGGANNNSKEDVSSHNGKCVLNKKGILLFWGRYNCTVCIISSP